MIVRGRVQGVFFRDSCRREARKAGVAGWVRNRPDGTVEAVFEGEAASVESMCRWCESGPPYAHVSRVDIVEESPTSQVDFTILRS
ncbi:acylphosphatase [Microlunatus panaciterrae]